LKYLQDVDDGYIIVYDSANIFVVSTNTVLSTQNTPKKGFTSSSVVKSSDSGIVSFDFETVSETSS